MVRFTNFIKAFGMSMLFKMAACSKLTMKTLILSTTSAENESITLNLNSYGIPYDLIEFSSSEKLQGNLTLYDDNNEPKYNLVVVNGGYLSYESDNMWVSALSSEQWAYLNEYEARNGVRRVVISEDISYNPDFELADPNNWGESKDEQGLIVETSDEIKKVFDDARIKITAPLDVNGIYHNRVKIINTNITKPFLYYSDNGSKGPVAAAITKYEDGREKMSFFFGCGSWSQSSIMLGHLWLTWGTRSLFNGFRRVYFTPHIDDVFLSTELVDLKANEVYTENSEIFRTTRDDYIKIAQFQKDVLKIMPEGSFYRVELAFNGNGLLLNVDYDTALEVDGERYVDLEFVKEPGTGENRWPKANYQFSSTQLSNFKKDDLYQYFANNVDAQKEFFWSSHTFSHENLDNVSRSDVDNEIRLNIEVAEMMGLLDTEYWSGGSIITPQISGLHNKDALEIFKKYGINSATGDLSRPAICNVANPYLPYYTTMESSNFEGFPVVPRTPTETYYFCSTRDENTWMYNQIYHDYFGKDSTWDEIAEREAKRTLLLMTKLRHEAHQFHQANLRYYKKQGNYGESLLEDWTRSVVNLYTKYVDWPLISIKMDDQAQTFIARAKLEACGHETKLIMSDNKITGVSVTATKGECTVPITVPSGVVKSSLPSDAVTEQIGKDPLTVWVPLKKGETKSFELDPPLSWEVNENPIISTSSVVVPTSTVVVDPTTTVVVDPTTTVVVDPTTTVVVDPTTTVVVDPTTTVVDPTTTVVVDPTTVSTVVVDPTTTVVVEPTTVSTVVVDPTTTVVVEPTTISTIVVLDPTTTVVVEPTTVSTVVVDPTTTVVVEPTTIDTIIVVDPTSTVVVDPTTTVVVDPTTTVVVDPTTTVVVDPTSTVVVDPTSSIELTTEYSTITITNTITIDDTTTIDTPTTTVVDPTTSVVVIDPTTTISEEPIIITVSTVDTSVVDEPTTTAVVVEPTTISEEPIIITVSTADTTVIDEPTTVVVVDPTTTIDEPTTSVVIETPKPTNCNKAWERCGGNGFTGSDCCVDGYVCVSLNEWYSQCVPGGNSGKSDDKKDDDDEKKATTTTTKKSTKKTTTTTKKSTKKTTTTTKKTTKKTTKTTTKKTTKKTTKTTTKKTTKKTTKTTTKKTTKKTTKTTTKTKKTTTKNSNPTNDCKIQAWDRCGGQGFTGKSCCPKGYTCKYYSEWYSQCVPN